MLLKRFQKSLKELILKWKIENAEFLFQHETCVASFSQTALGSDSSYEKIETWWVLVKSIAQCLADGFIPECKALENQISFWLLSWRFWVAVWNLAPFVALIIFKTKLSWEWAEVTYQKSGKIQTAIQNQNDSN